MIKRKGLCLDVNAQSGYGIQKFPSVSNVSTIRIVMYCETFRLTIFGIELKIFLKDISITCMV